MDLTHSFTVPTSPDDAWALFMDLEKVGGCFPGATVTEVNDDSFSGTVKVKLGPIALVYSGSGSFVERDDAAHRAVISAKGKDKRGNGTAGATVSIELSPDGTGTRADVVTDLTVTGKPAQFGRGVMQDVSDKLLQAFVACVEKQLTAEQPEQPGEADAAPAPSDSVGAAPVEAAAEEAVTAVPPRRVTSAVEEDDSLDLGAAVLPVLMQRYAGFAAAGLVGVLIGWLFARRGGSD
ncbi:MAG: SRPBCC family protein [Terracoccus sp.]